ncbi:uncharacterized protein [Musca autumnalis]|uniref:uncharacterized protein n=1 Tax=Musca autumnalis TaxID=221902 RepID=UPI003CEEA6F6
MIAQVSRQKHNKWDEALPKIMLAINTSVSESTGYSPAFLTQGREPRLPQSLYDQITIGTGTRVIPPEDRAAELKEIFVIVRRNLSKAAQTQKRHYNLRRRVWKPKIGAKSAKLAPKYGGPYVVQGYKSPVIAEVRGNNNEIRVAHLSGLKPYID